MAEKISFTLNGKPTELTTDGERMLLWVLRADLGLTGTKYGCGIGVCGACTVLVDNQPVRSCMVPVKDVAGSSVVTIEGLAKDGKLNPVQAAFAKHDGLQCGFCTPGMIMNAYALLLRNPDATREEIIEGMDYNLCRCGAHVRIVEAIEAAASEMKGVKSK
jgi:carbon-monoxide dehydrogenase small subunit